MSDLRLDFERELKFKISQKGKASQTDETTLIRAFRYFDLDNSGTVSQDEFLKAVQKIGVTSFENEEIRKLFNIYDLNKDGQLDYKEFAAILFGGGSFTVSKQDTPEKAPSRQSYTSEYQSSQSNYNEYKPWTYKSVPKGSEEKKKPERIAPSFEDMRQYKSFIEHLRTLPLIFQRFRQRLAMKGVRGFIGLYKLFINADIHDDGVISQKDFLKILRDFKMEMIEQDWVYIFAHFDRQGSGNISFLDFMTSVLGFFSKDKKDVVDSVWKKLDPHRAGKVPIGDIKGLFKDLRNHPDVKSGRKAEDQVYSEYLDLLEFHHGVIERSKSQYITQRELEAFLLYISAVIEDENYFEMVVRTTFKLTAETSYDDVSAGGAGGRRDYNPKLGYLNDFHRSKYQGGSVSANAPFGTSTQQQNVSQAYEGSRPKTSQYGGGYSQPEPSGYQDVSQKGSYSYQSEGPSGQEVLKEVKQKILGRGVRGLLGLVKFLRGQDEDRLKSLPVNNLIRALRDFRVDISEDKFREVFNYLGLIKNGRVDYEAFLNLVKGELDQQRRRLIVGIYERISRDKKGYVTIEDIKEQFNAKQHPEVRNGKRDEDDVFMEFVDTFDLYHDIFTVSSKGRDNRVSMEEFVGYYENISCLIPDDRQFEQIINNCWRKSYKNTWEDDTSDTYQQPYDYKKSYSRNY